MIHLEKENIEYREELKVAEKTHVPPLTATSIIVTLSAVVFFLGIALFQTNTPENITKTAKKETKESVVFLHQDPFGDIVLEARAAFVWDINQQEVIFAQNEEAQLPLASLTKLMTALVVRETVPEGTTVAVDSYALSAEGDSGLYANERWNLQDLLDITLISSSNDGARALAAVTEAYKRTDAPETSNKKFIDYMNEKAEDIGLTQTYFLNETGLDTNSRVSGGFGSARDVAELLEYIIRNAYDIVRATTYDEIARNSLDEIEHTVQNTNKIVSTIPSLIASKTGFTDLAGGNLVVAFDAGINHPIIVSVLGSTRNGRFQDVKTLIQATLEKLAQ